MLSVYIAPGVSVPSELMADLARSPDERGTVVLAVDGFDPSALPPEVGAERLLDHHWLLYKRGDEDSRRTAESSFFDAIATRYELEIDPRRNRRNYLSLAQAVGLVRRDRVLDFGCGPGLNFRAEDGFEVVGCDQSPEMRRLARTRGLSVVEPTELSTLASSFDAVIASYVLHLAIDADVWRQAAMCVRPGGRVAANFHKNRMMPAVVEAMRGTGQFAEISSAAPDLDLHGPVVVWGRRVG